MDKNLHDIDDLFRSALEEHEEIPSTGIKERLAAALDTKDAAVYKRKLIVWKRAALFLLMLLTGLILYDSGVFTTVSKFFDKRAGYSYDEKNKKSYPNNSSSDNINNDSSIFYKESANNKRESIRSNDAVEKDVPDLKNEKDMGMRVTLGISNERGSNNLLSKKNPGQKNKFITRQNETIIDQPATDKNPNRILINNNYLIKEKISSPSSFVQNGIAKMHNLPAKIIFNGHANMLKEKSTPGDSLSKNNTSKNTKEKKKKFFDPFWMLTGFASYDQVGYRLDSDQPMAINNIRYREVHEPSFSLGLLATQQLTRHWGLQLGLVYSNIQIGISPQKMYAFQDPAGDIAYKYITSSGYAYIKPHFGGPPAFGDSLISDDAKHIIDNISIPLVIKYTLPYKKISITPGAGVEGNFITKANLEVDIADAFNREVVIVKKLNGTKSFYWSFVADAELRYSLNKKVSVIVRPVYRVAISPITKNNIVETFPNSFGIGAGINIKL